MKHFSLPLVSFCMVALLAGCGGGKNSGFGGGTPTVTLTPPTLTFPSQIVGIPSGPPKMVTLTNSGTVTLNIMGIAASANYSADSSACGATLAAGANCVINVTFTPSCGYPNRHDHGYRQCQQQSADGRPYGYGQLRAESSRK
jgi:hypothetical protein